MPVTRSQSLITGTSAAGILAEKLSEDELLDHLLGIVVRDTRIFTLPIRVKNERVYYFDKEWNYKSDDVHRCKKFKGYSNSFNPTDVSDLFDYLVWSTAKNSFMEGMSLIDCLREYLRTSIPSYRKEMSLVDRLVAKVSHPDVVNVENTNEDGDTVSEQRVVVTVYLTSGIFSSWRELMEGVKKHKKEINQKVKERVIKDRNLPKHIESLDRLYIMDIRLYRNYTIEYVYGIRI